MKKKPTLFEALFPIAAMFIILGVGYGYLKLKVEPLLILSASVAALVAKKLGYTWSELQEEVCDKVSKSVPAILIIIMVGMMIGTWMISGTIPMMIYYGMKIIDPRFLLVTAFLLTALVSTCTGTSYGAAGTVGVVIMGIAASLDINPAAAAGAVVAGAYFGDKMSPLSDTTNLAPLAAGSTLYEHIRHMFYTTIPASILSLLIYLIVGLSSHGEGVGSDIVADMSMTLDKMYNWNIFLLLPVVIVLLGSVKKWPTVPTMLFSSIIASLFGIFYQGYSVTNVFLSSVSGFNVTMVDKAGFDAANVMEEVTTLVNRGGMIGMMSMILLVFCSMVFGGIITRTGSLDVILEHLLKTVKSTGGLITSTVVSCITMALVTGNSYLSILIPGELFADAYKERGLDPKNLSRTLEDSGTVIVPLVPWSAAGAYMAATLGVTTLSYLPWAIMCYTGFIFAIIWGYTGFGIKKINKTGAK